MEMRGNARRFQVGGQQIVNRGAVFNGGVEGAMWSNEMEGGNLEESRWDGSKFKHASHARPSSCHRQPRPKNETARQFCEGIAFVEVRNVGEWGRWWDHSQGTDAKMGVVLSLSSPRSSFVFLATTPQKLWETTQ